MSADFLQKDVIHINSINRLSGSSSNFTIDFSEQINPLNKHDAVSLMSFTCPKSYYLFSSSNNQFTASENGISVTITIPAGNYSFGRFATVLAALLNASLSYTYAVVANTTNGHFDITVSGNAGIQPIFDLSGDNSPYEIIGFEADQYQFSGDYLESVNIVNFNLTNSLYLCCDFVRGNNILSSIVSTTSDFSNITYIEVNPVYASKELTINAKNGRFYLLNGNTGEHIDLNGLNFNFTIAMFKKNDYYQHMIEDQKIQLRLDELHDELANTENELDKYKGLPPIESMLQKKIAEQDNEAAQESTADDVN